MTHCPIVTIYIQEPVRVCLGERRVWKGKGTKQKCVLKEDHFIYIYIYIPILETIQSLLRKTQFFLKLVINTYAYI